MRAAVGAAVLAFALLGGCSGSALEGADGTDASGGSAASGGSGEQEQVAADEVPEVGACRVLEAADVEESTNATAPVPCSEDHTAETFHVGELPADAAYDDPGLAAQVYEDCQKRWVRFTGANESLALRTVLDWAWFRPEESAWDEGARWYRCDVVAGLQRPAGLLPLPETAKGVLLGIPPDRWMVCVDGETVQDAPYTPCNEEHTWRAVSTIVVAQEKKYPGERLVEVLSRDFCSDSVIAWLNYPPQYDYAYTWFGEAEWQAGNKRAVCWARTQR